MAQPIPSTFQPTPTWFSVRAIPLPSVLIFAALAGATVAVALSIRSGQRARLHLETEQTVLRRAVSRPCEIETLTDPLDDLKDKLRGQQVVSVQEFSRLADAVRNADPSLHMTLAWAGADGRIKATSPENDLCDPRPGISAPTGIGPRPGIRGLCGTGRPALGEPYVNADDIKVRRVIPLFEGVPARRPRSPVLLAWISFQEPGDRVFVRPSAFLCRCDGWRGHAVRDRPGRARHHRPL